MGTRQRYFPRWIYETFPPLLIVGGLLVLIPSSDLTILFLGLALAGGGTAVLFKRFQYRRAFSACKGYVNIPVSSSDSSSSGHVEISWRSSYDCGHPVIDAQHRRLFGMCSQLISAASGTRSRGKILALFDNLVTGMAEHFDTEEQQMAMRQPLPEPHQAHHRAMVARAWQMRESFKSGLTTERELVGFATYDVIINHILTERLNPGVKSPKRDDMKPTRREAVATAAEPVRSGSTPAQAGRMIWQGLTANVDHGRESPTPGEDPTTGSQPEPAGAIACDTATAAGKPVRDCDAESHHFEYAASESGWPDTIVIEEPKQGDQQGAVWVNEGAGWSDTVVTRDPKIGDAAGTYWVSGAAQWEDLSFDAGRSSFGTLKRA